MDLPNAAVDLFLMLWGSSPHRAIRWDYPHSSEFIALHKAGLIENTGFGSDGGRAPGYGMYKPTTAGRAYLRLNSGGKR
jgi:hypothetical protein